MTISAASVGAKSLRNIGSYGFAAGILILIIILCALAAPVSAVIEIIPAESYAESVQSGNGYLTAADVEYYLSNANT